MGVLLAGAKKRDLITLRKRENIDENTYLMSLKRKRSGVDRRRKRQKKTMRRRKRVTSNKNLSKTQKRQTKAIAKAVVACGNSEAIFYKNYVCQRPVPVGWDNTNNFTFGYRNGANNGDFTAESLRFAAFTGDKLLDAASILYNGKNSAVFNSPQVDTNNFSVKTTRLDFKYCSYTLTVKNNTDAVLSLTVYKVIPKRSTSVSIDTEFVNRIGSENYVGAVPSETTRNFNMMKIESLKKLYHIEKKTYRFVPGTHITLSDTWHGCMDLAKWTESQTSVRPFNYLKGISIQYYFQIDGELQAAHNTTGDILRVSRATYPAAALSVNRTKCLLFETKEVYKLMEPDTTVDAQQGDKRILRNFYEDTQAASYVNGNIVVYEPNWTPIASISG
jgi:hypothetical protein